MRRHFLHQMGTNTTPSSGGSNPLDGVTGAIGCYSLRKLLSSHTGSCVRVRETTGGTETDIGWTGDYINTTALDSHIGAGQGFIVKWYDQSGGGYDLAQTNTSKQPEIIVSTHDATKRALKFNGDALWINLTTGAADFTSVPRDFIFVGYQTTNSWQIAASLAINSSGSNGNLGGRIVFYAAKQRFYIGFPNAWDAVTPSTAILNNMHLFHSRRDSSDTITDVDDGDDTVTRNPNKANYNNTAHLIVGAQNGTTGSSGYKGEVSEFMVHIENGLTSGEVTTLRGDIMTYYGI